MPSSNVLLLWTASRAATSITTGQHANGVRLANAAAIYPASPLKLQSSATSTDGERCGPLCLEFSPPESYAASSIAASMSYPFVVRPGSPHTTVEVECQVAETPRGDRLVLRSSANVPFLLEPGEWPEGLAWSVDIRSQNQDGADKGRVLAVWLDRGGRRKYPVAVCCWHLHPGAWPLCILDAGYRLGLPPDQGKRFVERFLFAAIRDLAEDLRLQDTQTPRPTDHIGWAVSRPNPGGGEKEGKRRAKAIATRAMGEYGFERVGKKDRPTWAKDGFYGQRVF